MTSDVRRGTIALPSAMARDSRHEPEMMIARPVYSDATDQTMRLLPYLLRRTAP